MAGSFAILADMAVRARDDIDLESRGQERIGASVLGILVTRHALHIDCSQQFVDHSLTVVGLGRSSAPLDVLRGWREATFLGLSKAH